VLVGTLVALDISLPKLLHHGSCSLLKRLFINLLALFLSSTVTALAAVALEMYSFPDLHLYPFMVRGDGIEPPFDAYQTPFLPLEEPRSLTADGLRIPHFYPPRIVSFLLDDSCYSYIWPAVEESNLYFSVRSGVS
jgi:hypothetical protein